MNPSILTQEQLKEIVAVYKQAVLREHNPTTQAKIRNKIVEYEFYLNMGKDRPIPFS